MPDQLGYEAIRGRSFGTLESNGLLELRYAVLVGLIIMVVFFFFFFHSFISLDSPILPTLNDSSRSSYLWQVHDVLKNIFSRSESLGERNFDVPIDSSALETVLFGKLVNSALPLDTRE